MNTEFMVHLKCRSAIGRCMAVLLLALALGACSTPKNVTYFQDLKPGETALSVTASEVLKVRPFDKIYIMVNTRDSELQELFNVAMRSGTTGLSGVSLGYTVDAEGYIDFPILGKVLVAGLSRQEIAAHIKSELIAKELVKDPVVLVEYMNLNISVLGDVSSPGRYSIDRDKLTILDAISMAGDLSITAKRDRILVLREVDGQQRVYNVNMLSAEELYASPVYYLQQNDVVYVEPNNKKVRESTPVGNMFNTPAFWMSLVSFMISICSVIF